MRYSAFISYNHRDREWAKWLHRALEHYRVPKRLWGRPAPWGELGARLPPVFRDRDELATSADLAASVRAALAEAATLVVICSPNSARSRWVDEEIRTFIAQGRARLIRLIIVDGEPHSGDPATECLPPSLVQEGAPEPLAADVRAEADGKQGAKLKVLAGILDVPYDELRQREAARRQRRLIALATAASVGFLIMSALTAFALASRADAVRQRHVAEQRTLTAERTLDFVKGMFAVADPSEARGATITAREILDGAAQKLDGSLAGEPTVKAELGLTLSEVYGALGLYQESDGLVRRTLALSPVEPETRARQYLVLAESQARLADYDRAVVSFRSALRLAGSDNGLHSRILVGLGQALSALEQYHPAQRALQLALRVDEKRDGAARDIARDLEALGANLFYAGKAAAAKPFITRALAMRLRTEGAASPSVSDNLNMLGNIAYRQGDLREAERLYRERIPVDEKVLGRDHPDLSVSLNNLARALVDQRCFDEAGRLLERAIAISLKQRSATHDDMAYLFTNLAIVRRQQKRLGDARDLLGKGIAAARAHDHPMLGTALTELALLDCRSGKSAIGLDGLKEARAVTQRDYPDDPWRLAWVRNVEGECLVRAGRKDEGMREIRQSAPVVAGKWPAGTYYRAEADARARAT
jgi:tetratricopeptide (TPR) repeat protein